MRRYLLSLSMATALIFLTGCTIKETTYTDTEEIHVSTNTEEQTVRIHVKDTYTKDGVEYYVFTIAPTVSTEPQITKREFTLSKNEYQKYIGLENDAIDCQIHELRLDSSICKWGHYPKRRIVTIPSYKELRYTLLADLENDPEVSFYELKELNMDSYSTWVYLSEAEGETFEYGEYSITLTNGSEIKNMTNSISIKHYSFLGESADFTEEEIDRYKDIMDAVNRKIL